MFTVEKYIYRMTPKNYFKLIVFRRDLKLNRLFLKFKMENTSKAGSIN